MSDHPNLPDWDQPVYAVHLKDGTFITNSLRVAETLVAESTTGREVVRVKGHLTQEAL